MLLIWGGYSLSLWGWCLVRDYDLTLGQLTSPLHPYGSGQGQMWPPGRIPDTQIWPGGAPVQGPAGAAGAAAGQAARIAAGNPRL